MLNFRSLHIFILELYRDNDYSEHTFIVIGLMFTEQG